MTIQVGPTRVPQAIVVLSVVALLVAACGSGTPGTLVPGGGGASPVATQSLPVESAAPEASSPTETAPEASAEEPAETPEASAPASPAGSPAALGDVAQNLAGLTSYRFKIQLEGQAAGASQSAAPGESPSASQPIVMEATVVLKPEKAMKFTVSGVGGGETGAAEMSYILVGDKLWMSVGGQTMELPAGTAGQMMTSFEGLAPDKIFASAYGSFGSGLQQVGTETKNGVQTVHYRADRQALQGLATALGGADVSEWSADVWIAADGNYLVSAVQKGKVTSGPNPGDYLVSIDVTNINDPANKVEAPK